MTTNTKDTMGVLKSVGSELTQWENRLEYAKAETEKQTRSRDALVAEISRKTDDFNQMMAMRDAEVKKNRADMLAEREDLNKQKAEFMDILKQHQIAKENLSNEQKELEIQKLKHASTTQNVQEYIQAVRRASGLLGI